MKDSKIGKPVNRNCIIVYYDIYGFGDIVEKPQIYKKKYKSLVKSISSIWNWIETNINSDSAITMYMFSDCVVMLYPLGIHNNDEILIKCLSDLELILDRYLDEGFFVRGALACGNVTYAKNLIVSREFNEAVRIESNHCPGPFIIVPAKEISKIVGKKVFINTISLSKITLKMVPVA